MESKVVELGKEKITVRELTVKEIRDLARMPDESTVVDRLQVLLKKCAGIDPDQLLGFAPSDLQPLIDSMLEVNASFFAQAAAVGMESAGQALRKIIGAVSMIAFSSVSTTDMDS